MGIHRVYIYRSPNIGIFLKGSDKFLLTPRGLADSKAGKLSETLKVNVIQTSISGSRLLGPLIAMNTKGIIVSRLAEESEIASIRNATDIPVEILEAKYTCIGNLVAVNDSGAVASTVLPADVLKTIHDVFDVPVETMSIASYTQVGSMIVATNQGGVIHPKASEEEVALVNEVLKIEAEPCTVNGGVPFVGSGLVAKSGEAIVGTLTSGPELVILARALKL
ncbi:MAG: translation initiation factor IF-6 [Thaumarchaeota archaeon]|nr:translation initiation factor IF-6 [Nitrososphaerota archaeon]